MVLVLMIVRLLRLVPLVQRRQSAKIVIVLIIVSVTSLPDGWRSRVVFLSVTPQSDQTNINNNLSYIICVCEMFSVVLNFILLGIDWLIEDDIWYHQWDKPGKSMLLVT